MTSSVQSSTIVKPTNTAAWSTPSPGKAQSDSIAPLLIIPVIVLIILACTLRYILKKLNVCRKTNVITTTTTVAMKSENEPDTEVTNDGQFSTNQNENSI